MGTPKNYKFYITLKLQSTHLQIVNFAFVISKSLRSFGAGIELEIFRDSIFRI